MPLVAVSTGLRLHYEEAGRGPSLLFTDGVGAGWVWFKNVGPLSQRFRVVVLDGRGTGLSDKPPGPYSIPVMARELVDVIERLGLGPAHVVGLSIGGQVALEAALEYPAAIASVIPVGAGPGAPLEVPPSPATALRLAQFPWLTPEQNFLRNISAALSPGYLASHPGELALIERLALQAPTPLYARLAIGAASAVWRGLVGRAAGLRQPVLVLSGQLDQIAPLPNALALARLLPQARLHIFPGSGHLCQIEQADAFDAVLTGFLLGGGQPVFVPVHGGGQI